MEKLKCLEHLDNQEAKFSKVETPLNKLESSIEISQPATMRNLENSNTMWNKLEESIEPDTDSNKSEVTEVGEKLGGSYNDVFREGEGDKYEVHHMPSDSSSYLERGDGPAIKMEKADHQKTASWGTSREAREYRAKQRELIEQGKFEEAVQMDIDDIHEKFGDKYDDGIEQMKEYIEQLKQEGKING